MTGLADTDVRAPSADTARLAELIRGARSVVALTGAGISTPSGIPDFRTPRTGLWENVDPMAVAHIDAFRSDPVRFWSFYGERRSARSGRTARTSVLLTAVGVVDRAVSAPDLQRPRP